MANHALGEFEGSLNLAGRVGRQLKAAQDVHAIAVAAYGIRETPAAPVIDGVDAATPLGDHVLNARIQRVDGGVVQIGVEHHHELVLSHLGCFPSCGYFLSSSLEGGSRKGCSSISLVC